MGRFVSLLAVGASVVVVLSCSHDQITTTPTSTDLVVTVPPPVAAPAPTIALAATPSTAPPPAPPTPPPASVAASLPMPVAPPVEDGTPEGTKEVGTIEIPKTGLRAPIYEGVRLSTLDNGPGHWPGSAMPGDLGNVVVAGHRTSHNAEFRHLDELVPGDEVLMTTAAGQFVYRVTSTEIVPPDALWILDQRPARTATLFACHPPGSLSARIVVHLDIGP